MLFRIRRKRKSEWYRSRRFNKKWKRYVNFSAQNRNSPVAVPYRSRVTTSRSDGVCRGSEFRRTRRGREYRVRACSSCCGSIFSRGSRNAHRTRGRFPALGRS
jgi:hypothetical protein